MRFIQDIKNFTVKGFLEKKPPMAMDDGLIEKVANNIIAKILDCPAEGKKDLQDLFNTISALREENTLLKRLSLTDPLTGAYNGRYFDKIVDEIATNNMAKRNPTGRHFLMMLDLDGFKRINDTYGHEAGDMALIHTVRTLNDMTRKTDSVCRMGGDEFIVILKDATQEGARAKIIKISEAFDSMFFEFKGINIPIRASIGWSELKPDDFIKDVLSQIDKNVYVSKQIKGNDRFEPLNPCDDPDSSQEPQRSA